ncbi:MAG: FAD-dependent oxidoreductase [Pseudomonadota bacterium]|nr:FAD-dependent oxidoreductase [Pseudomonadota bacterium]
MTKATVAIIGTGAAGLACGHFLHDRFDLTLYETNDYIGGHANSVTVSYGGETVRFDTAFVVFNNAAYPLFMRLLEELKVPNRYCPMSFSFQIEPDGLQYMTHGLTYCFCDLKNLRSWRFLKMLFEMVKFHRQAREVLTEPRYRELSIAAYMKTRGYGDDLLQRFLIPLIAVTWSLPPEEVLAYPVLTLVEFLDHHGALQGIMGRKHWRTVVNGSRSYVDRISEPFRDRTLMNRGVTRVRRGNGAVEVEDDRGERRRFDHLILACHGDQALALLADPTPEERELLGRFRYHRSQVLVHTDTSLMPRNRRHWAGWNYHVEYDRDRRPRSSTTYHMNTLQKVSKTTDYFVTFGDTSRVHTSKVLKDLSYEHPIFDLAAIHAQVKLHTLNQNGRTFFCGSYFKYGFHEDAFRAGVEVCRALTGESIWA